MGYFYWLRVKKNSNHLHTELVLVTLKTKFYFENKASFTLFLLSGSGNSALFGTFP